MWFPLSKKKKKPWSTDIVSAFFLCYVLLCHQVVNLRGVLHRLPTQGLSALLSTYKIYSMQSFQETVYSE